MQAASYKDFGVLWWLNSWGLRERIKAPEDGDWSMEIVAHPKMFAIGTGLQLKENLLSCPSVLKVWDYWEVMLT